MSGGASSKLSLSTDSLHLDLDEGAASELQLLRSSPRRLEALEASIRQLQAELHEAKTRDGFPVADKML